MCDDENGFVGEVVAEDAVLAHLGAALVEEPVEDRCLADPLLTELRVAVEGEAFDGGHDRGEDPLGCGDVVDAAAIAEGDAFGEPRGDPVDAGHHGLNDFDVTEVGEGLGRVLAEEEEDPEVDREGFGGVAGDAYDLGFGWEIG